MGPVVLARICAVLTIPLLFGYPFMTYLSGHSLSIAVNCTTLLKNILSVHTVLYSTSQVKETDTRYFFLVNIINTSIILQNNATPQDQRGAANGIAMTTMSLFKTFAPAAGGAIFSWAQKRQHAAFLQGDQMVFFMLSVVEFIGLLFTFRPFLGLPNK